MPSHLLMCHMQPALFQEGVRGGEVRWPGSRGEAGWLPGVGGMTNSVAPSRTDDALLITLS